MFLIFFFAFLSDSGFKQSDIVFTHPEGQGRDQTTWLRSSEVSFNEEPKVWAIPSSVLLSARMVGWVAGYGGGRTASIVTTGTTGLALLLLLLPMLLLLLLMLLLLLLLMLLLLLLAVAAAGMALVVVITNHQQQTKTSAWVRKEAVMKDCFCPCPGRSSSLSMATGGPSDPSL